MTNDEKKAGLKETYLNLTEIILDTEDATTRNDLIAARDAIERAYNHVGVTVLRAPYKPAPDVRPMDMYAPGSK